MNPLVTPIFMGVVGACFAALWWMRRQHDAERTNWLEVRARYEARAREEVARRDEVLDAAPLAVVVCDDEGVVWLANRAARDLLSSGAALVGRELEAVLERCPPGVAASLRDTARPLADDDVPGHTLYMV